MRYVHGMRHSRVYNIWCCMRQRCQNPESPAYDRYGGRGICVCERWQVFANFLADMGEPADGLSIERRDNALGYSPENCYWANATQQSRNRRCIKRITVDGVTLGMSEWAERLGLSVKTISMRLQSGWDERAAVTTPKITLRAGIKRGERLHAAFGVEHGVEFADGVAA